MNQAYPIQKDQIQQQNETYNNQLKTYDELQTAIFVLVYITCAVVGLALIFAVMGHVGATFACTALIIFLVIVFTVLCLVYYDLIKDIQHNLDIVKKDLDDLNKYVNYS